MDVVLNFFRSFYVFNVNAFYSLLYFLKHNFMFIIVLIAVGYIAYLELKDEGSNYTNDERKMI